MFILGVIPARAGSKGIPGKNLFPLNGKPLIQYTIDAAKNSVLSDFLITSDDETICNMWQSIKRPKKLAQDDTPMLPVIQHAVEEYEKRARQKVDYVMTLQPTSPLRTEDDINSVISSVLMYKDKGYIIDSAVSVCSGIHPIKSYIVEEVDKPRPFVPQEPYDKHKHKCITRNGAIFLTKRELLDSGKLIGDDPLFYLMPKIRSIDIDDMEDMMLASIVLKAGELH